MQNTPGLSQAAAQAQAAGIVLSQVVQQGTVLAFGDAYRFTFYAALTAIVLSLFLPGRLRSARTSGEPKMVAAH